MKLCALTRPYDLSFANKGVVFQVGGAVVTQERQGEKKEQNHIGQVGL